MPLALSGVVLFGVVLFGVPVPLLLGIWPCGLVGDGVAVVFGLVALGVSPEDVVPVDEPVDIELSLLVVPVEGVLLIEPPDVALPAALVLPGLESCC